ncbi:MAG: T9SS C-terminal target domain-containing protein [Calditrichaeota bacterium]|nr:MAG: T9SS C-terminal target domain-containing protein [Calditrichota bacterium]MBL1205694.1 T9SS C-terminal target domain-containing protein [Calditrichota bacterium]NOG45522.1 T9SS type A sorting domain-containing protein [Calditrichota bacterium]
MKIKTVLSALPLFGFLTIAAHAQDYPIAPEIWSEPVRLDTFAIRFVGERTPSLTKNLDTLYFRKHGNIYSSVKLHGVWQTPVVLNSNVNNGTPTRSPSISKDGKRLYYSAWGGYGGWDLWFNDWSDSLNDWGPAYNMGPVINSSSHENYLYEVSRDTIYTVGNQWVTDGPAAYAWDDTLQQWRLLNNYYWHPQFGIGYFFGLSITKDKKKMYYGLRAWDNEILNERGLELCVSYWDSTKNTWGGSNYLNINTKPFLPDSNINDHVGGTDQYPWISEDGTVLFFQSDNDAALEDSSDLPDIYVSYLLVDENGDSVTTLGDKKNVMPQTIKLGQNYPNPFNPSTKIKYSIAYGLDKVHVQIKIFNILGEEVGTLLNARQNPGDYTVGFNATVYNLSSGIYLYQVKAGQFTQTKKMLYLR